MTRTLYRPPGPVNPDRDREPVIVTLAIPRDALPPPVAAPPELLSQRNILAVCGIPPRTYLALLRRPDAPPVTAAGKLRLVSRVAFVAWLASQATTAPAVADDAPPANIDGALARYGFRRVSA